MLARRHGSTFSLIVADVDNLKTLNDASGHHCGDRALRAPRLCAAPGRPRDRRRGALGGDEFAMLLHETDQEAAMAVATRLSEALHDVDGLGPGHGQHRRQHVAGAERRARRAPAPCRRGPVRGQAVRARPRRDVGSAGDGGPGGAAVAGPASAPGGHRLAARRGQRRQLRARADAAGGAVSRRSGRCALLSAISTRRAGAAARHHLTRLRGGDVEQSGRQTLRFVTGEERRRLLRPGREYGRRPPATNGGSGGARSVSRRRELVHHGPARGPSAGRRGWWASEETSGSADDRHRESQGEGRAHDQGSEDPPSTSPTSLREEEVCVRHQHLLGPIVEHRGRSRQQVNGSRRPGPEQGDTCRGPLYQSPGTSFLVRARYSP